MKADGMVNIMTVERTLDRCGVTHRNRYWTLSSPVTLLLYTIYTWKCIQQPTLYSIQYSDIIPCIVVVGVSDVSEMARVTVQCPGG